MGWCGQMKSNSDADQGRHTVEPVRQLRARTLVTLLVIGLLPVAILGSLAYFSAYGALANDAADRLALVISTRQRQIEAWIDGLSATLYRTLASLPTLPDVIHHGEITALTPAIRSAFEAAVRPETGFTEAILVSADDRLLYSTNFERYTAPRRLCLPRIVCASEFLVENGQTRLIVQYPILDPSGTQVGALLGLAPLGPLDGILGARQGLGVTGTAYLVGPNGQVRWAAGQGAAPANTGAPIVAGLPLTPSVQVSAPVDYAGPDGAAMTGMTAFIPRLYAWLAVEQAASEIYQPLANWAPAGVAAALLTGALAIISSRWLTLPIDRHLTEQQAALRETRRMLSRTEEIERRRGRALADMGHELRTPINSILNFSGFLNDGLFGTLNADQTEMLRQIHSSSQHLLELINDLIDMSQVEAGQMRLFVQPYDPAPIFDQVIGTLHSLILDKSIAIYTDLPRSWPLLQGDRRRVLQILLNLVSNAAKFTDAGSITIRAHTYPNRIEVRVEDTGPGVAPEAAAHLFEPFQGGQNARSQEKGGTGLGLALSHIFARMHGGDLTYTPGENGGAVFSLSLPINALGAEPVSPPAPIAAGDPRAGHQQED